MTTVSGERPVPSFDETRVDAVAYGEILRHLREGDLSELRDGLHRHLREKGVCFRSSVGSDDFLVDAVPRIFAVEEWAGLRRGLIQRAEALERFVADVYGAQGIVAAGVVPERVVGSANYYEPGLGGARPRRWITIAGLDIVRGADGRLRVLEDNVRTPSGLAYALAARRAVGERVAVPEGRALLPLSGVGALLAEAVRAAAPEVEEPTAVLLTDGRENSAFYEHETLAELAGFALVEAHELEVRDGHLWHGTGRGRARVDVVYRRTDADRAFNEPQTPTALGALLDGPWRAGNLGLVNAFGTGVADDKLTHVYVEDMVRFYLGEEPALPSVTSYDLSVPESLEQVLDRLEELVVKPRDGHGGTGVVIGPLCPPEEVAQARERVRREPAKFVAQEMVVLSEHPTICDGELAPRHVDLRPFVLACGDRIEVVPGGLTRVALDAGAMIVNSSRNGGAKDTWVLR